MDRTRNGRVPGPGSPSSVDSTASAYANNQYSRHALNSFVHSGIHPLRRAREGFPLELAETMVRFSNGLMHFAYRMFASLSGSQRRMDRVTHLYKEFTDCVPMAKGSEGKVGAANA